MNNLIGSQLIHHAAIGRVALNCTHLEDNLQSVLWRLAGLDARVGRCITQHMPFRSLCDAIITVVNESPKYSHLLDEIKKLLKDCNDLRVKRNDTVHALWGIFLAPIGKEDPDNPQVINAGTGEVTGMVIKARGQLSLKINHTTVFAIDKISEEIIELNRRIADFATQNLPDLKAPNA